MNSKITDFFKNNWLAVLLLLIVVGGGIVVFSTLSDLSSKNRSLQNLVEQQQERTLQNLADITNSFQRQVEAQEKLELEFNSRIEELDRKYNERLTVIQNRQRTQQKVLVSNPSTIPAAYSNVFGIPERSGQ